MLRYHWDRQNSIEKHDESISKYEIGKLEEETGMDIFLFRVDRPLIFPSLVGNFQG
jgi:hypothetical protein